MGVPHEPTPEGADCNRGTCSNVVVVIENKLVENWKDVNHFL
jgi:hypothetical protein